MKKILTALLIFATQLVHADSDSANKDTQKMMKKSGVMKNRDQNQAQLGTSFRFDKTSLNGKYQSSPSTVATVENGKFLDDLLGVRKNFNDRIKQDKDRN